MGARLRATLCIVKGRHGSALRFTLGSNSRTVVEAVAVKLELMLEVNKVQYMWSNQIKCQYTAIFRTTRYASSHHQGIHHFGCCVLLLQRLSYKHIFLDHKMAPTQRLRGRPARKIHHLILYLITNNRL
jgi:hypothetical protein